MASSHKRDTNARLASNFKLLVSLRAMKIAAPIALMATAAPVTVGTLLADGTLPAADVSAAPVAVLSPAPSPSPRPVTVSRDAGRVSQAELDEIARDAARKKAIANADTRLWTTTAVNVWTAPGDQAVLKGEIPEGRKVLVTGRRAKGRAEIVWNGMTRWVSEAYLSASKPITAAAGLSMKPCPDPSVERGLTQNAVYVYRSVCHAFPQITSYGGWDDHGEHSSGRALDIMTSDVALGDAIADFLKAHAGELHLFDILWRQQIWTPVRASEGWRGLPSRGSATANHYDHVHVSVT